MSRRLLPCEVHKESSNPAVPEFLPVRTWEEDEDHAEAATDWPRPGLALLNSFMVRQAGGWRWTASLSPPFLLSSSSCFSSIHVETKNSHGRKNVTRNAIRQQPLGPPGLLLSNARPVTPPSSIRGTSWTSLPPLWSQSMPGGGRRRGSSLHPGILDPAVHAAPSQEEGPNA